MVKNLAIIPARSGSKRIPDKNIIDFMGKPLMAYTIEAAISSGLFECVFVSTDSEKYAEIAIKYGAEVPFLRTECSDDITPLNKVYLHTLTAIEEKLHKKYDCFCALQVSCPLRTAKEILGTYNFFIESKASTVLTCAKFNFMNPWWAFKMENKEAHFVLSEPMKSRSQDNEELFYPTGAVGFAKIESYKQEPSFYGKGHKFFPIDWKSAIDIDNYEDLELAKAVFVMQK